MSVEENRKDINQLKLEVALLTKGQDTMTEAQIQMNTRLDAKLDTSAKDLKEISEFVIAIKAKLDLINKLCSMKTLGIAAIIGGTGSYTVYSNTIAQPATTPAPAPTTQSPVITP